MIDTSSSFASPITLLGFHRGCSAERHVFKDGADFMLKSRFLLIIIQFYAGKTEEKNDKKKEGINNVLKRNFLQIRFYFLVSSSSNLHSVVNVETIFFINAKPNKIETNSPH